jgi:hypothetical protein
MTPRAKSQLNEEYFTGCLKHFLIVAVIASVLVGGTAFLISKVWS